MINYENKAIYDNLKKLEKANYLKGLFVLLIMAVIIIIGMINIGQLSEQSQSEKIGYITDNKSIVDSSEADKAKKLWINVLIGVNVPLFILMLYFFIKGHSYEKDANQYCPYCYTKGFTTTTLNRIRIRTYVKNEKYKDSNGRERIKRVLYEDWEGQYRNECCGKVYQKTWQEKIDLG